MAPRLMAAVSAGTSRRLSAPPLASNGGGSEGQVTVVLQDQLTCSTEGETEAQRGQGHSH